jgi:WD40 repeat protein
MLKEDPEGITTSSTEGDKKDYDLTRLYVTHDEKFWYFGWPVTRFLANNITYGLMIDVDNETSGTTSVPEDYLVNTNTTHSGYPPDDLAVADVAVSPDGTMIATISSDNHIKIWSPSGVRLYDLTGHTAHPYSLAWSPDSRYLASRDASRLYLWDTQTGRQAWPAPATIQQTMTPTPPDDMFAHSRESLLRFEWRS